MNQPEIAAGDLLLRPWRGSDAAELVRAWSDPEIRRWTRYGATLPDRENVGQWVEWNDQQWQYGLRAGFAVCPADGNGLVGSVMLRDFGRSPLPGRPADTAETGYWIAPAWRGRGAARAALAALSAWAFDPLERGGLGLRRIELRHSVRNEASCRVARKTGYGYEGTMRQSYRYADGDWHDEHLHARLSTDDPVVPGKPSDADDPA